MGRHAYGDEVRCGAGGCRNLAEWLIMSDQQPGRNQPVCQLHRDSQIEVYVRKWHVTTTTLVPLHSVHEPPPRKRRAGAAAR